MEGHFPDFILKMARQVISGMICSVSSLAEAAETAGRAMVLEMVDSIRNLPEEVVVTLAEGVMWKRK